MNTPTYRPSDDGSLPSMGRVIMDQIINGPAARVTREEIRRNCENSRHCFQHQLEQQQSSLATTPRTQKVQEKSE